MPCTRKGQSTLERKDIDGEKGISSKSITERKRYIPVGTYLGSQVILQTRKED